MTQALATKLLRHWGQAGFLAHCAKVAHFYKQRRDAFIAALERNLIGKATWTLPAAGMFIWVNLCVPPAFDSFDIMTRLAQHHGILAIPGVEFMPDKTKTTNLRLSFTMIPEDKMDEACSRIAKLVEACWEG
jgi:tryptophan aminotransferase